MLFKNYLIALIILLQNCLMLIINNFFYKRKDEYNVIWKLFMKLDIKKLFYAFVFMVVSFLLMRYYAYLENPDFGIGVIQNFSSRGLLTYLIYFIFSLILYSAVHDMHILNRAAFVVSITFLLAFFDAMTDYASGFNFSITSLMINGSSAILSFLLILFINTFY